MEISSVGVIVIDLGTGEAEGRKREKEGKGDDDEVKGRVQRGVHNRMKYEYVRYYREISLFSQEDEASEQHNDDHHKEQEHC